MKILITGRARHPIDISKDVKIITQNLHLRKNVPLWTKKK